MGGNRWQSTPMIEHALGLSEGQAKPACLTGVSYLARGMNVYDNEIAERRGGLKHEDLSS